MERCRLTLGGRNRLRCLKRYDECTTRAPIGRRARLALHNLVDRTRGIQKFKYPRDRARRPRETRTVYNDFEAYRDPETLLRAITSVPGSLHPQTSVGEIQAGNRASLLVLDPDHPAIWPAVDPLRALAYCDAAPAIQAMMVGGNWLVPPDEDFRSTLLSSPDFREAVREARERRSRLFDTVI